jgi:hypothetical protein
MNKRWRAADSRLASACVTVDHGIVWRLSGQAGIALQSLKNQKNHRHLLDKIRKKKAISLGIHNWHITFTWIRAHVGHYGNELVDKFAKEAVGKEMISYSRIPIREIVPTTERKEFITYKQIYFLSEESSDTTFSNRIVNLFVSSVLFVFWYHSPNVLDTPHIWNISRLRVNTTVHGICYISWQNQVVPTPL